MGAEPRTNWQVEWESESNRCFFPSFVLQGKGGSGIIEGHLFLLGRWDAPGEWGLRGPGRAWPSHLL